MLKKFLYENFHNNNQIQTQSKSRIEFVDLAKGLCILLVIVYHTEVVHMDIPGLKALRMPLYFILSGLFFKTYGSLVAHTLKKLNKILIPFLFFYLLSWLELSLLDISPWNTKSVAQPLHALFTERIGPIWFLECLFLTTVSFCAISVLARREPIRFAIVMAMGAVGYYLSTNDIFLPCQIDVVFTSMPFFYFGYVLKRSPLLYPSKYDGYALPAGIALLISGVVMYYWLDKPFIEFWDNTIKGGLLSNYILSVIFVVGVLLICKHIKWLPLISYTGRYSIIVLVMHQIVLQVMKTFEPYLLGYGINYIYFLFTFGISWLSIPYLRKYFPHFTAQKDLFTEKRFTKSIDLQGL